MVKLAKQKQNSFSLKKDTAGVFAKLSWEQKKGKEAARSSMKELEKELKDERKEKRVASAKRREAKKARKRESEIKGGTYQVITQTSKINKWNKRAKGTVMKMAPEQIDALLSKRAGKGSAGYS